MSGCAVVIGGGDYDGCAEFESLTEPVARRNHICCECHEVIARGMKYERVAGKFDGDMYVVKTCSVCAEIRDAFASDHGAYPAAGELWMDLSRCFRYITTGCFARLSTAEAKAKLREKWMKWKGIA